MSRRRRAPRGSGLPGLVRRGSRAYYSRTMPEAVGGDRVWKSLDADWGSEAAWQRAAAVSQLWDRGDWPVIRRWAAGEIHISDLARMVREGDFERLKLLNADGYLLGQAVEEHLRRTEATLEEATLMNHRVVCSALIERFGADRPMHTITTAEAEAWLHGPREDGEPWAPGTQYAKRAIAGALWRYAIEREQEEAERQGARPTLRRNPWRSARVREAHRARPAVLTPEELRDLLAHPAVYGTPVEALIGLAGYAGLRLREMLYLRPGIDVVLDGPRPMVRIQAREGDYPWRPKTQRSERDVRISPTLADTLRRHIAAGYAGTRYLFRTPGRDRPVASRTAQRWIETAFKAAGLKYGRGRGDGLTTHSLRHTHATILLSQGVSIAAVAARLGDTKEVVLSTYAHVLPDDEERALEILERAARGGA